MHLREALAILLTIGLTASVIPVTLGATTSPTELDIGTAEPSATIEENLLAKLTDGPRGVILHHDPGVQPHVEAVEGFDVLYAFENIPAVYGVATDPSTVRALASTDTIDFVEDAEKALAFHLDTATTASRAREVYEPDYEPGPGIDEPSPELTDKDGNTIDGRGVGVAIVDSGFDGTHPDFQVPGKQAGNYVVTPAGVEPGGDYTMMGSPHGTYVAGSAAADGTASGGQYRGAAPGASLYTFATWRPGAQGVSDGTVLAPAIAFDWILSHGDAQDPPIRIVANAWSCTDPACNEPDAPQAHLQLATQLASQGDLVLFSVGNDWGEGFRNQVNPEARIQAPGVLGVGAHDDEEIGARKACVPSFSSRGDASDPSTWPDVIAPGVDVRTPQPVLPSQDSRVPAPGPAERRTYTTITGTSASTGHAAGVAALVLQANPALAPVELEHILEVTAHELGSSVSGHGCEALYARADPTNPSSRANYAAGHGLVDAMDAVQLAQDWAGLPIDTDPLEPLPDGWIHSDAVAVGEPARTFYMTGEGTLTEERPPDGPDATPAVRAGSPGELATFTSPPLEEGFTTSALEVDVWLGSTGEWLASKHRWPVVHHQVERVLPDGSSETLLDDTDRTSYLPTGGPWLRTELEGLDPAVSFEAGDRIRVSTGIVLDQPTVLGPVTGNWLLYTDAHPTPSRIVLGTATQDVDPGSTDECQVLEGCSWVGGDIQHALARGEEDTINCAATPYRVAWTGPPGSGVALQCNNAAIACVVPGDPGGAWASCEATEPVPDQHYGEGQCVYLTPDGRRSDGYGRCEMVR